MANALLNSRNLYRMIYVALAVLLTFLHLLPMQILPTSWAAPDLLMAFTFAWTLRRPDYVPIVLVAIVMLISDLVFLRPPGLQAAMTIIGAEFLRSRMLLNRELPFTVEWALVGVVFLGIATASRLALMLVLSELPDLSLSLLQLLTSILAYPVAVLISVQFMNVRKLSPVEFSDMGHRL